MSRLKALFTQPWNLTGWLLAFGVSVYAILDSQNFREPAFLVDPIVNVVQRGGIADAPVKVLRADGTEVTRDVFSARLLFWNAGREPIRQDEILDNIVFSLDDPSGRILHYRVGAVSRDVTRFTAAPYGTDNRQLLLTFRILEHGDGGAIHVLYEAEPGATFSVRGAMEGVSAVSSDRDLRRWTRIDRLDDWLRLALCLAGFIAFMWHGHTVVNAIVAFTARRFGTLVSVVSAGAAFALFLALLLLVSGIAPTSSTQPNVAPASITGQP